VRILADTSLWYRHARGIRQAPAIQSAFEDVANTIFLSAVSSFEIVQKWKTGKLPCPDPQGWLDEALEGFEILPITESIARKAALWDWPHKDPADQIIAAAACIHSVELWHSDTVLKGLPGFPHRYFKAPAY
jgi:PIN domain nuclease of toxin-antitoxin system